MARAKRVCSSTTPPCGKPAVRAGRCADHAVDLEKQRGSTTERGYGAEHQADRARLMKEFGRAYRNKEAPSCWRCGLRMHPWQNLHADHSKISAREGGKADCLTHASCNTGKVLPGVEEPC